MAEITLRFATAEDAGILLGLVRELAVFEKAPEAVLATEADFRRHGFGPEPRFEALLDLVGDRPAGFAPGSANPASFSRISSSRNGRASSVSDAG